MFSLRDFTKRAIRGMIGNYPDFQVMEYSLNWYGKGILAESDLAEIQAEIETRNVVVEPDDPENETELEEE